MITYEYEGQNNGEPSYGSNPQMKSNGRGTREVVQFPPNVPVQIALKYPKPKPIETKRGITYMLTTQDNRVAFLDADPALKLEKLGLEPGERLWIVHKTSGKRGDLGSWDVYLDDEHAQDRASRPSEPGDSPEPPAQNDQAHQSTLDASQDSKKSPAWAQTVLEHAKNVIDVYAAAVRYANDQHQGLVSSERVWSILATVIIGQQRRTNVP